MSSRVIFDSLGDQMTPIKRIGPFLASTHTYWVTNKFCLVHAESLLLKVNNTVYFVGLFISQKVIKAMKKAGFKIRGSWELRAPLNSPTGPSNFCREPKNVLVSVHNTCKWLFKMQLSSLEKILISSPEK